MYTKGFNAGLDKSSNAAIGLTRPVSGLQGECGSAAKASLQSVQPACRQIIVRFLLNNNQRRDPVEVEDDIGARMSDWPGRGKAVRTTLRPVMVSNRVRGPFSSVSESRRSQR